MRSNAYGGHGLGAPGYAVQPPGRMNIAPMTLPKDVRRVNEQSFWSTYQVAGGTALAGQGYTTFTTPIGQGGQGFALMSIAETNMPEAGRMPNGVAFDVSAFALNPYMISSGASPAVSGDNLRSLLDHCVFRWAFLQTTIDIAPIQFVGAGGGIFGATADAANAYGTQGSMVALNNGNNTLWTYQNEGVQLPSAVTFNVVLQFGNNAPPVDGAIAICYRVALFGLRQTAIPAA